MSSTVNLEQQKSSSVVNVAAILPAYESAATVEKVLKALPRAYFKNIILVDNHSKDNTFEIASRDKSILVYRNEKNLGYGGNLKKCFRYAMDLGADILIEIHPDGEYGLEAIEAAIQEIKNGAGIVFGNRFAKDRDPLKSGMFFWKYPFIISMNWVCNLALGTRLGDLHQGFRVYSSKVLNSIDYNNNADQYIFGFQIIVQALYRKFSIRQVPVSCHYSGKKRGAKLGAVIIYSLAVFGVIVQYWLAKLGMPLPLFKDPIKK